MKFLDKLRGLFRSAPTPSAEYRPEDDGFVTTTVAPPTREDLTTEGLLAKVESLVLPDPSVEEPLAGSLADRMRRKW